MEYEEWIKEVGTDENSPNYIHGMVSLKYYPFTNRCPTDGKICEKEGCDNFEDNKCLYFEVDRISFEAFGPGDPKWRHFDISEDKWLDWRISVRKYYPEKTGGKQRIGISVGSDNCNISWRVMREIGLAEYFKEDEYPTTSYFEEGFEILPRIEEFYEAIKSKMTEINKLLRKYHTCVRCGKVHNYIDDFDGVSICSGCQNEIVEEWIHRKFLLEKYVP